MVRVRQVIVFAALGISLWSAVVHLARARHSVGGADFFYYVCHARDMLLEPGGVSVWAYRYFPGVYAYWRGAIRWGGPTLDSLQTTYVVTLVANGLLIGLLVGRICRSVPPAVYAAVWYWILCSRFQGFEGVTEPIATLPFLVGLCVWKGRSLSGAGGWWSTLGLGVGLGLAIYTRQQAGLLSLGAGWLLGEWCFANRSVGGGHGAAARRTADRESGRPHEFGQLAVLPAVAAVCLLLAILGEGHGLWPLREGLRQAREYPQAGSFAQNIYTLIRCDETAAVALAAATGVGLAWALAYLRRGVASPPWLRCAGFCVLAAVATLVQFARRPYLHYALLTAPPLIIAAVVLARQVVHEASRRSTRGEVWQWGLLFLGALPWAYAVVRPATVGVWRVVLPRDFAVQKLWHEQPEVRRDLEVLRRVVAPGDSLVVVPPRLNSIHYLLGSRSEAAYGYSFGITRPDLDLERLTRVLVVKRHLDEADEVLWGADVLAQFARQLESAGFQVEQDLPAMTLYRKRRARQ